MYMCTRSFPSILQKIGQIILRTISVRGYDSSSLTQDMKIRTDSLRNLFLEKQALMAELKNLNTARSSTPGIPVMCLPEFN